MTFDDVRTIGLALPGVEDGTSYGTPCLKVRKKLLTRLKEDRQTIVLFGIDFEEREMLMAGFGDTYFITEHYRNYPSVLARLVCAQPAAIESFLQRRWRALAPRKLIAAYDAAPDLSG